MLLSLFLVSQAKALSRHFIIELQKDEGSPKQVFFVKGDWHSLTGNPSEIYDNNCYVGSTPPSDKKRYRPYSYGMKTSLIESLSWQWLYALHLLVGYELALNSKDSLLSSPSHSWVPLEVAVVGWFLKNYWSPDSSLFNPIEQQETKFILRLRGNTFPITTMMPGSGDNPSQCPPSESSSQQATETTRPPIGYFPGLLHFDSGGGNGGPQKLLHTLGLNCFVFPCYGVCQFLPSGATPPQNSCPHTKTDHCLSCIDDFDPKNATQSMTVGLACSTDSDSPLYDDVQMPENFPFTPDHLVDEMLSLRGHSLPEENGIFRTIADFTGSMGSLSSSCLPSGGATQCQQTLSDRKKKYDNEQVSCDVTVFGEYGQQQPCGRVYMNANALTAHKNRYHSGQRTCDITIVGGDGWLRPCGKAFKNVHRLSYHKSSYHCVQQNCDVTEVGEDGQSRPCGKAYRSVRALSDHKRRSHSGPKSCKITVFAEDGQLRPCGKVCKNNITLSVHKIRDHTGQQTCDMTVVGLDGQPQPCGRVCKNTQVLLNHKRMHRKPRPVDSNRNDFLSP